WASSGSNAAPSSSPVSTPIRSGTVPAWTVTGDASGCDVTSSSAAPDAGPSATSKDTGPAGTGLAGVVASDPGAGRTTFRWLKEKKSVESAWSVPPSSGWNRSNAAGPDPGANARVVTAEKGASVATTLFTLP